MNLKMIITGENSSLWFCCFSSLSVAETHAGDDRSDAGTDEDEIRRVKESKEQKGSTVIPTPPTHTHVYTHTHTWSSSESIPACRSPGIQDNIICICTLSSSLQTSIHQLFRSSPLMVFFFNILSRLFLQSTSKSCSCPNLRVRVCWVGRGET